MAPEANAVTSNTTTTPPRPAAGAAPAAPAPVKRPSIWISGRIQSSEQVAQTRDGMPLYETLITMPAPDPYSYPPQFCVASTAKLGRKDEDLTIEAEVQCRPWTDQKGKKHYPHYLWAVRG